MFCVKKEEWNMLHILVGRRRPMPWFPPRPGLHLERNEKYGMGNCYVAIGSWDRPVGSWEWKIGSATMRWNAQNMNCWNGTSWTLIGEWNVLIGKGEPESHPQVHTRWSNDCKDFKCPDLQWPGNVEKRKNKGRKKEERRKKKGRKKEEKRKNGHRKGRM